MKKSNSLCMISVALAGLLAVGVTGTRADSGEAPVAKAAVTGETGTVRGNHCNVRSRPSTTAEVVVQLNKGDTIEIRETKSVTEAGKPREWLRIGLPATAKCFVMTKLIADGAANAHAVNVHCGPGKNFREIGKLAQGDKVEAVGTHGEWTQIKPTGNCSGWISADLVAIAAPAPAPAPAATPVSAVAPPPAVPTPTPAPPAAPEVKVVSTGPEVMVQYVIKEGIVEAVANATNAPASYELRTPEEDRMDHRICYLTTDKINLQRYTGKSVRVFGDETWRKDERYPVLAVDRIDIAW